MQTKKAVKEAIVKSGRDHLRQWMQAAETHGTIYYTIPHVAKSGMSRNIVLATIRMDENGKPYLENLWPKMDENLVGSRGFGMFKKETGNDSPFGYSEALDIVGKDYGFNWDKRCFTIGGCGMDMVFALVDDLAHKAGLNDNGPPRDNDQPSHKNYVARSYANRVRRESF
jgi:hypothetical protein